MYSIYARIKLLWVNRLFIRHVQFVHCMGGSPGELSEELVTLEKGCRMSCDVGEVTERLENELCSLYCR